MAEFKIKNGILTKVYNVSPYKTVKIQECEKNNRKMEE